VRAALVALAVAATLVAALLAQTDRNAASAPWLPLSVLDALAPADLTPRPGDAHDFGLTPSTAIEVVRTAAFLGEGPAAEPEVVPVLVSGPIARGPLTPGEVIPNETDVPFWLVFWQGVPAAEVGQFLDPGTGDRVDAVFLVDGVTGDCCWVNRVSAAR
jgi:hypothetical protein